MQWNMVHEENVALGFCIEKWSTNFSLENAGKLSIFTTRKHTSNLFKVKQDLKEFTRLYNNYYNFLINFLTNEKYNNIF